MLTVEDLAAVRAIVREELAKLLPRFTPTNTIDDADLCTDAMLSLLSRMEAEVIRERVLNGRTMAETAKILGCTQARVRSLEAKAMKHARLIVEVGRRNMRAESPLRPAADGALSAAPETDPRSTP